MNATQQAEAARRLAVALDLAGLDVEVAQTKGGNVVGYLPVDPARLLASWQQKMFRVSLREEHGARIVGTISEHGIQLKEGDK